MENFDEPAFLSTLRDTPWDTAYVFDDLNDIWSHWGCLLKQAIDDHAPSKRVYLKSKHLPWINQTIQNQMRFRNHLYGKLRRSKTSEKLEQLVKCNEKVSD